jgi:hypothetical protein
MVTTLRHPIEILQNFEENFRESVPKIMLKMPKRKMQDIKSKFTTDTEDMSTILNTAMKNHNITPGSDEEKKINARLKKTRLRILMSYLSKDFENRYEDELRGLTGSTDFFQLLGEIIGTVSDADLVKDAKEKLADISRDTEEEETFSKTRFIKRVSNLVKIACKDVEILTNHYIEESWNRNLTPELRRYLLDQDKMAQAPQKTAEFLDKMKKYKRKPDVNVISARDIIFQEQTDNLSSQFASFPDMIRESLSVSISSIVQQQVKAMTSEIADIHRISAKKESQKSTENQQQNNNFKQDERQRFSEQPRSTQHNRETQRGNYHQERSERSYPDHLELAPNGKPFRCATCGVLGHRSRNCRGTNFSCRYCGEVGHLKFACPKKQSKN